MGQFTKQYFIGTVQSFDGRIYSILIPDGQAAILKYSTVHQKCKFPTEMLEDDHLKAGASIKLCRIVKNDKGSILPDHRFYYSGTDNANQSDVGSDDSSSIAEFTSLLVKASADKELTKAVKESMRLFSLGFGAAAIILLSTILTTTKAIKNHELK